MPCALKEMDGQEVFASVGELLCDRTIRNQAVLGSASRVRNTRRGWAGVNHGNAEHGFSNLTNDCLYELGKLGGCRLAR